MSGKPMNVEEIDCPQCGMKVLVGGGLIQIHTTASGHPCSLSGTEYSPEVKAAADGETSLPVLPAPGRIVCYVLTGADADAINNMRGHNGRISNEAEAGDHLPMMITWRFPSSVNGQVFVDGNFSLWITSAEHNESDPEPEGTWHFNPEVK